MTSNSWADGFTSYTALVSLMTALLLMAVVTDEVHADGRFPELLDISFHPTDRDHFVVMASFGLLLTEDGGGTFRWVCRRAFKLGNSEDPNVEMMGDGSIVATIFDGVMRSSDGGCDWEFPSANLERVTVIDQDRHPVLAGSSFAVTSAGGVPNTVFRTDDNGQSWSQTSAPFEFDDVGMGTFLFERIRVAPGDADRVYLSGAYPPASGLPRRGVVHRSSDGGETWVRAPFGIGAEEHNIYLLGVDPMDSDRLFMHVDHHRDFPGTPDRIVRSDDAGDTWETLIQLPNISAFAIDEDGRTVWVGARRSEPPVGSGRDDGGMDEAPRPHGLWRSLDGGRTFDHIDTRLSINCLASRSGELWVCADEFADGYALGRSVDGGESFEPVFSIFDITGAVQCNPADRAVHACVAELEHLNRDLMLGDDDGDGDGGVIEGVDAGMRDAGGDDISVVRSEAGCSCSIVGGGIALENSLYAQVGWLGWLFACLLLRRRSPSGA